MDSPDTLSAAYLTPPAQGAALKPVPDRSYGTADELLVDLRRI